MSIKSGTERKKSIKLSYYKYKPDEIEAMAKEEYKKRLASGNGTSMAECRRVIQNLTVKVEQGPLIKEEIENLAIGGVSCFNLKRFSKEEKDYAVVRWNKYKNDLGAKGIDVETAPNDFAVRRIIEMEIQIQREWSFLSALPIKDKSKVHNESIKTLGHELRQMLDSLNAMEKSSGKPGEAGGSLSDLAQDMVKGKEALKKTIGESGKQVDALREKKGLAKKDGQV